MTCGLEQIISHHSIPIDFHMLVRNVLRVQQHNFEVLKTYYILVQCVAKMIDLFRHCLGKRFATVAILYSLTTFGHV